MFHEVKPQDIPEPQDIPGFVFQRVPGDGHCLYHAVSLYVGMDYKQLRNQVADYVQDHTSEFQQFVEMGNLSEQEAMAAFIAGIRASEYADNIEIEVLERVLQRNIVIHAHNGIRNRARVVNYSNPEIHVYYNGHDHYDALLLEDNAATTEDDLVFVDANKSVSEEIEEAAQILASVVLESDRTTDSVRMDDFVDVSVMPSTEKNHASERTNTVGFSEYQLYVAACAWAQYLPGVKSMDFAEINRNSKISEPKHVRFLSITEKINRQSTSVTSEQLNAFVYALLESIKTLGFKKNDDGPSYIEIGDSSSYEPPSIVSDAVKKAGIQCLDFGLFPFKSVMRIYANGNIQFNEKIYCTNAEEEHYGNQLNFDFEGRLCDPDGNLLSNAVFKPGMNEKETILASVKMDDSNDNVLDIPSTEKNHACKNTTATTKVWAVEGDFSKYYHSGGLLNRSCDYINGSTHPIIKKIFLGGYRNKIFQISAKAVSEAQYSVLKQAVMTAGFPVPEFSDADLLKVVRVSSADPVVLNCFLNALKKADNTLGEIEADICSKVGLTALDSAAVLPAWQRSGTFGSRYRVGDGNLLHRQVSYRTSRTDSAITQFSLLRYTNVSYMFSFELNPKDMKLKRILKSSGLDIAIDKDGVIGQGSFEFNANNRRHFNQLMALLSKHSPHFAEIADAFKQHVVPVIDKECSKKTPKTNAFFNPRRLRDNDVRLLLNNNSFFKAAENNFLIDNRHTNSQMQHEYDTRYGLVLKQN